MVSNTPPTSAASNSEPSSALATAPAGTKFAYRVRAYDANSRSAWSELLTVTTTPSLDLRAKRGTLRGAGVDGGGTASLRMKFALQPGVATAFDPVADGISFTIAGAGADQVVSVPPGDPGWTSSGAVSVWEDPAPGVLRIVVDSGRRRIKLDAGFLSFDAPQAATTLVRVEMTSGGSRGVSLAPWRRTRSGQYRHP